MSSLTQLNARLTHIIQMGQAALHMGGGRGYNPLYDEEAVKLKGFHHKGRGKEQSIPISKVISAQASINSSKTRSIKDKIKRGTLKQGSLPEVQSIKGRFVIHDGNHRIAAALRAGKRTVRALVQ